MPEHPFPILKKRIDSEVNLQKIMQINPYLAKLTETAQSVVDVINQEIEICSSNLPNTNLEDQDYIQLMVYIVQKQTDKILQNPRLSPLEKIFDCVELVKNKQAGNCQHKTMLAFLLLIERFIRDGLITENYFPSLDIQFCDFDPGHFFLIIEDAVVCDPWAQIAYPLEFVDFDQTIFCPEAPIKSFFKIQRNWSCEEAFTGSGILTYSENSYNHLLKTLPKNLTEKHQIYCNEYWTNYYSTQNNQEFWKTNTSNSEEIDISDCFQTSYN